MEYTNENGYSVKVLIDPVQVLVQDISTAFISLTCWISI